LRQPPKENQATKIYQSLTRSIGDCKYRLVLDGLESAVLERISATPGVKYAAVAFQPPFTSGGDNSVFSIRDRQAGLGDHEPYANYLYVTSDYF
jgi:hypothetical protein